MSLDTNNDVEKSMKHRPVRNLEDCIVRAKEVFGDRFRFDYSKFEYKNITVKSTIICTEHNREFTMNMRSHLAGCCICSQCPKKGGNVVFDYNTAREWVDSYAASFNHNGVPKYTITISEDEFNNGDRGSRPWKVVCAEHGDQYRPGIALITSLRAMRYSNVIPCQKCVNVTNGSKRKFSKDDIARPIISLDSLSGEICNNTVIIRRRGKTNTLDDCITRSRDVFGDRFRFDYSKFVYKSMKFKSVIICTEHSREFTMSMNDHLEGRYLCPLCPKKTGRMIFDYAAACEWVNVYVASFDYNGAPKYKITISEEGFNTGDIAKGARPWNVVCAEHGATYDSGTFMSTTFNAMRAGRTPCLRCANVITGSKARDSNKKGMSARLAELPDLCATLCDDILTIETLRASDVPNWRCVTCNGIYARMLSKRIKSFTNGRSDCVICSNRGLSNTNNLSLVKDIDILWDYEKNGDLKPTDITMKSHHKIWVNCKCCCKHPSYEVTALNFANGSRCPFASGTHPNPANNFGLVKNALRLWDYEKNGDLKPTDITMKSGRKIWEIGRAHV